MSAIILLALRYSTLTIGHFVAFVCCAIGLRTASCVHYVNAK